MEDRSERPQEVEPPAVDTVALAPIVEQLCKDAALTAAFPAGAR